MAQDIRPTLVIFLLLTLVTGVLYPAFTTLIGALAFPDQARGSMIERDGVIVGSRLIGQPFASERYFFGRPSATSPMPYNGGVSSGSNQGPTNPALTAAVAARIAALAAVDPDNRLPPPVDLVTASGSGLDPDISPAAANYQVTRIARVRGLDVEVVRALVRDATTGRTLGVLGEPRVNVLALNLALDARAH